MINRSEMKSFGLIMFVLFVGVLGFAQDNSLTKSVDEYVNKAIGEKKIAGAVVLVQSKGEVLLHKAYGKRDLDQSLEMDTASIFRIYSMTKSITTLSAMFLVDRGELSLEDPIEKYLPELKELKVTKGGSRVDLDRSVTIRDLMRHTSGFAYGAGLGTSKVDLMYNTNHPLGVINGDQMMKRLSAFPLQCQPGTEYNYSISADVLGVIVERVSGLGLGEFMSKNIFEPLGMKDTHFRLPEHKVERFCSIYGVGLREKESYSNSEYVKERFEAGGGMLVSTSSDYNKFCNLMLNQGIWNGDTLLKPEFVAEMTKNQLPKGEALYKRNGKVGVAFGLGFSVNMQEWGKYGHEGDYGWSGIGGTHFVVSPKTETIVIIMTQKQPFSDKIKRELTPIVFGSID